MPTHAPPPGLRRVVAVWLPMAATWLMMAVEGPILAAVVARLAEPKQNLAAFGVAFAVAVLIEAPVIMILSAATALVDDAGSFRKLRNFTYALNLAVTLAMLVLLFTPLFERIATGWIGLPDEVTRLTHGALVILLPWPAAIGYRRFYHGLLIRSQQTRRIAYGTVVRITGMSATAVLLYSFSGLPGAWVGAAALTLGVVAEGVVGRLMSLAEVRRLRAIVSRGADLTYRRIVRFYYPLALTSVIALVAPPAVTFFMGQARFALESLAVLPVVNGLSFIFRAAGLSYQEVAIGLLARNEGSLPALNRFATLLGTLSSIGLGLIAFTPLATLWYHDLSGLSLELTAFALLPTKLLFVLPALSVLLAHQRAILVHARRTVPITWATLAELTGIVGVLVLALHVAGWVGVTGAAAAFVIGRLAGNLWLVPAVGRAVRELRERYGAASAS